MNESLIKKTVEYVNGLHKIIPNSADITFSKVLHDDRSKNKDIYNKKHPLSKVREGKISRNHADEDLWWGLLAEFEIAKQYGKPDTAQKWYQDQLRQNNKVLINGVYDCKDIGNTQVRAAEWTDKAVRRMIYRPNDFRTKSTQPVIACVVNTVPNDVWIAVCGFMSWEDLKARREEFWDDPDGRGYPAMWVPYWEMTPMEKFKQEWLSE